MSRNQLFVLAAFVLCIDCTFSANAAPTPAAVRHYYGFYDDGGEHPVDACDVADELPAKLTKQKDFAASEDYIGSEQTEFAEDNEATIDAWRHYFSSAAGCDKAVKKSYRNYEAGGEPVDAGQQTPLSKQADDGVRIQKSIETLLACLSAPTPAKTVVELQHAGMIEKEFSDNVDSISYFKVTKPFEVWGLKVTHVLGYDDDPKIFGRAPGAAPVVTFGVVVPYSVEFVKQKLASIAVTGLQLSPSLLSSPPSKDSPALTEIACVSLIAI